MEDQRIAVFELLIQDEQVKVVDEKHYKLVPASEISKKDLEIYRART